MAYLCITVEHSYNKLLYNKFHDIRNKAMTSAMCYSTSWEIVLIPTTAYNKQFIYTYVCMYVCTHQYNPVTHTDITQSHTLIQPSHTHRYNPVTYTDITQSHTPIQPSHTHRYNPVTHTDTTQSHTLIQPSHTH